MSINFTISHKNDGDLVINLKGPNGNVINLANHLGGNNDNFSNTTIASDAILNISSSSGSSSFGGTWLPHAQIGIAGAQTVPLNTSNSALISDLYGNTASFVNGFWKLSARDVANGTNGEISNWSITVNYTTISNVVDVTWSPVTDLFTDPGATSAYTAGTAIATVYAKPSAFVNQTYIATLTNSGGCSVNAQTNISVKSSPAINMLVNYCSPLSVGKIRITATSDISVGNTWVWGNSIPSTNTDTTSYIDVDIVGNYYVSANAAGGCQSINSVGIAQELVVNGDFEAGNVGFITPPPGQTNTGTGQMMMMKTMNCNLKDCTESGPMDKTITRISGALIILPVPVIL